MGKHSLVKQSKQTFNKTLAIALAAGVSFGGVTVPQMIGGNGTAAVAYAESGNVPQEDNSDLRLRFSTATPSVGLLEKVYSNKLIARVGQLGSNYEYMITAEALKNAGIDPSKEFIVESGTDDLLSITKQKAIGGGRTAEFTGDTKQLRVADGEADGGISLTLNARKSASSTFADIKQGDKHLIVNRDMASIIFFPLTDNEISPGARAISERAPLVLGPRDSVKFSLANAVQGASVNPETGQITYTPPKNFSGGYVEIEVKAEIDKESLGERYVSGRPYSANATYRVYVEPQPNSDLHITEVKKVGDNYEITRSDKTKWTINLSDLNKRIKALEDKDAVSPDDFKKVQDDLKKAQDGINGLKGKDAETDRVLGELKDQLNKLTPRVDQLEKDVKDLKNSTIKEVVKNDDGSYTLIREDGTAVPGNIDTSGAVTDVKTDGKGNLIITVDGEDKPVPLEQVKVTEDNEGKPNHTITITTPDGKSVTFNAFDNYVTDIVKNDNGDYDVYRSDVEGVWKTIEFSELRNEIESLKGKDAEQDKKLTELENRLNDADSKLGELDDRVSENKGAIEQNRGSIDKINKDLGSVENDVKNIKVELNDLKERVGDLEDSAIKNVRDNGDGTYTIIRNNGDEVEGTIGDGQDIKEIKPNDDGTITIVRENGDESKVDLKQVTIKEENKGTPEHTVTITSPNGDTVTFNVFDKYVTNVVKNENGNYDIYRSDVDGGKTVWKTIVLSDLRDKISNLEDRADKLEKKDQALQDEIDELKDRLGKAEDNIKALQDKTEGLEDDVRKINAHLSTLDLRVSAIDAKLAVLEGRVDDLEDTNKKWAECYSGIGMAAIPLAIAAPLAGLANMDIPFLNQANTDIQKRLGVYNPDLAKAWGQYGGIMKAVAGLVGLMGAIGAITYAGNQCNPYNQTDDAKDTKLGQLSSKFNSAKAESSSKK